MSTTEAPQEPETGTAPEPTAEQIQEIMREMEAQHDALEVLRECQSYMDLQITAAKVFGNFGQQCVCEGMKSRIDSAIAKLAAL